MENREVRIKELGEALAVLCDSAPSSKEELKKWYDDAQKLIDEKIKALNNHMPHFLWHYLSDADIRMKDEKYAEFRMGESTFFFGIYVTGWCLPTQRSNSREGKQ